MKYLYGLIIWAILFINQSFCQFGYHSTYRDANNSEMSLSNASLVKNSNTFFISGNNSEGPPRIFLLSIDSNGEIIYSKKIDNNQVLPSNTDISIFENSIFLLGYFRIPVEFHPETFIAKINQNGTLTWFKLFEPFIDNIPTAFTIHQDGSILISGYLQEGSPLSNRIFLLKLNDSGNISSLKRIVLGAESAPYAQTLTADGGYAITGYMKQTLAQSAEMFVMKLDSLLTIQYVKTYSSSNPLNGKSIKQLVNGDFIIAADMETQNQANKISLIRINSAGEIIWAKYIPGISDKNDSPSSMFLNENDNIYLTGITNNFTNTGTPCAFLSKVDSDGNLNWFVSYYDSTQTTLFNTAGRRIISSNNAGLCIIGGRSVLTGPVPYTHLYFLNTDSLGNSDCYYSNMSVNFEDLQLNMANRTPTENAFSGNMVNSWQSLIDYNLITEYPCDIPVEFTSFTANEEEHVIRLNWITATENNNRGFEIEKKSDNKENTWRTIGFVQGAGTSTEYNEYKFFDNNITESRSYYRLKQIDYDGTYNYSKTLQIDILLPNKFALYQNYPNPFNPVTNIQFSIPQSTFVTLKVYDVLGNEIKTLVNEEKNSGRYQVSFDGKSAASGVYFYTLRAGNFVQSRKMLLLK